MDDNQLKSQKLINNFIYFAFIFSALYIFGLSIKVNINLIIQIIIILLIGWIIKFFLLNPIILYILMASVFVGSIIINHYITPIFFIFVERVYFLFSNIINNIKGIENISTDNILPFWIVLLIIFSIITAIIVFKNRNIYILLPIYIPILLFYWYMFFDQAYAMILLFLIAFIILYGFREYEMQRKFFKNDSPEFDKIYNSWTGTVITYVVLIIGIAFLVPKSLNYIQWDWMQNKVYSVFPIVEDLRSYDSYTRGKSDTSIFNFSSTGYQGDPHRLGGPVKLSNRKIMTVETNSVTYLRGNVKQTYTGNNWVSVNRELKSYSLLQDFSKLSEEEKKLYYDINNVLVTFHDFASNTFFSPYKPIAINSNQKSWVQVGIDSTLTSSTGIFDSESYNISFAKPFPYGKLLTTGITKYKNEIDDLSIYLQIPTGMITERTKVMVSEIVAGLDSDFDKAKSIESYLRDNYSYNLEVNPVPDNREFIDYFLFDEQQGYCTYYATTMAMMLRLQGIPSRYVEGYLVKDRVKINVYEVKQENAHAWVEAFIEPVGWMTFEATPAYPIETRLENYRIDDIDNEDDILKTDRDPNIPRDDEDEEDFEDYSDIGIGDLNNNLDNSNTSSDLYKDIIPIIILILLLILPIRFIIGWIKESIREKNANNLTNNKRIIYLYQEILDLTTLLGFPQNKGETHNEYSRRIAYKFYDHNKKGISEITDIFVKTKYGNIQASDSDVSDFEEYRTSLESRLRNYLGVRKYYYRKYLTRV